MTPFGSRLAPVTRDGAPAMLKIATSMEERDGARLLAWWAGEGAAKVFDCEDEALFMERAMTGRTLSALANDGQDHTATRILCGVGLRLHQPRPRPPPQSLRPLETWFRALAPQAAIRGGRLAEAAAAAESLLASPRDVTTLHGDLHHDNVLDFGERGWLAIDPKGLLGERGYDYANLFCNPWPIAAEPDRFERRLTQVCREATLEPGRLRQWILAYAGLSAAWTLESGMPSDGPWRALQIADLAAGGG